MIDPNTQAIPAGARAPGSRSWSHPGNVSCLHGKSARCFHDRRSARDYPTGAPQRSNWS